MYIAIAGNIGSGKTSLTEILTERYKATAYFEDTNNPYIGDFYEEIYLQVERPAVHILIEVGDVGVVDVLIVCFGAVVGRKSFGERSLTATDIACNCDIHSYSSFYRAHLVADCCVTLDLEILIYTW